MKKLIILLTLVLSISFAQDKENIEDSISKNNVLIENVFNIEKVKNPSFKGYVHYHFYVSDSIVDSLVIDSTNIYSDKFLKRIGNILKRTKFNFSDTASFSYPIVFN